MNRRVAEVGLRQAWRLADMPLDERLPLIAAGLPIITKSAHGLARASLALEEMPREAELADEEAAKVLILTDVVRCPSRLAPRLLPRLLKAFCSHGARLIYARACSWRPADLAQLRQYVDDQRRSHYVDGPNGGDLADAYVRARVQIHSRAYRRP